MNLIVDDSIRRLLYQDPQGEKIFSDAENACNIGPTHAVTNKANAIQNGKGRRCRK